MCAAVDRPGGGRELCGLGRSGHARTSDPPVRDGRPGGGCRSIPRSTASKRSSRSRTRRWPSCGFKSPGLRAGHYLCFFGMHVLTPAVFELLERAGPRQRSRAGPDPAHDRARFTGAETSVISRLRPGAAATTSASSSAWSRPRSPWPWRASTASESWRFCSNRSFEWNRTFSYDPIESIVRQLEDSCRSRPDAYRDDHRFRSGDPGSIGARAGGRGEPGSRSSRLPRARGVSPGARKPLRARARVAFPARTLPLRDSGRRGDPEERG